MNIQVFLELDSLLLAQPGFAMPALEHLLAKGSVSKSTQVFEAALCEAFGIEKQLDWPVAALSWLGEGNDPGDECWLYADPVNLQLQRDYFSLNLPVPVPLDLAESEELIASLNRHFSEDGLQFSVAPSGQWYLRMASAVAVKTSFPTQAAGRDIRDFLPIGAEADKLRSVLNEMQMLLHEHPVNKAREERGEVIINSLWLSGSGRVPIQTLDSSITIFTDIALAKGLALVAGNSSHPLPGDFSALDKELAHAMLVPGKSAQSDEQWLMPMSLALKAGKIRHLTIELFANDQHVHLEVYPVDMWKFWRKPQPLGACFQW